ncbi:hypothetical protein RRG08_047332 [Elysia crispata]|uniref:Uncharacterized protein n=1 Tax=Elysia crispata TaxID=231223 RepID=A0AAE1E8Q8_9GAST|nr:hypothetical protein RRG08_047332 [Elysia crispata]
MEICISVLQDFSEKGPKFSEPHQLPRLHKRRTCFLDFTSRRCKTLKGSTPVSIRSRSRREADSLNRLYRSSYKPAYTFII